MNIISIHGETNIKWEYITGTILLWISKLYLVSLLYLHLVILAIRSHKKIFDPYLICNFA